MIYILVEISRVFYLNEYEPSFVFPENRKYLKYLLAVCLMIFLSYNNAIFICILSSITGYKQISFVLLLLWLFWYYLRDSGNS